MHDTLETDARYPTLYNAWVLGLFPQWRKVAVGMDIEGDRVVANVHVPDGFHPVLDGRCTVYPEDPRHLPDGESCRVVACSLEACQLPEYWRGVAQAMDRGRVEEFVITSHRPIVWPE